MAVPAGPDPTVAFHRFQATGDPKALAAVFDTTAAELLRVASHLVSDLHVAEDLVQSTFLTAIEHRDRFAPDHEVLPWLLGILANHARRHRSGLGRRPDPERVAKPSVPGQPPEAAAAELELTEAVGEAIGRLPEPYRPVLMLHLRHGFSAQEIALDLGRPPATVRQQLRRGLEHLRRALPAGIASVCGLATGGLAQVRATVLQHVAGLEPVTLALGGALLMKKTVLVVSCVLVGLATWLVVAQGSSSLPTDDIATTQPLPLGIRAKPADALSAERSVLARPGGDPEGPAKPQPSAAALAVRGIVVTKSGDPVPGAAILVTNYYGSGQVVTHSNDAGRFKIASVQLGRLVSAYAHGWAPCPMQVAEGDPGSVLELRLALANPGVSVQGRVLGPDARPVAGARIMVGQQGDAGGWIGSRRETSRPPLWLRSDADGRFDTHSAPARVPVYVHGEGLAPWSGRLEASNTELVVHLPKGGVLAGRVVDGAGKGVAGAWIYVGKLDPRGPPWQTLWQRSDEEGRFEIRGVPAGHQAAWARNNGLRRLEETLDFVDGTVTAWYPVLQPAPRIAGRVVDEHGIGLAGYRVQKTGSVTTGRDGSFVLVGCEQPSCTVTVYHPDDWGWFALAQVSGVVPDAGECVIRLDKNTRSVGTAKGVLQHADGRPLGRVPLSLWRKPFSSGTNTHSEGHTGAVHFKALPPGQYRLDIRAPDYPLVQRHFTIQPGANLDLGVIRLERPGRVVVKVSRRNERVVRLEFVGIVDKEGRTIDAIFVRNGSGRSEPLPCGHYTLRGSNDWLPPVAQEIDVAPGRESIVHFNLDVCTQHKIHFVRPRKDMNLDLEVTCRDDTGRALCSQKDLEWPAGHDASITWWLAPGAYKVKAKDRSGIQGSLEFVITDGTPDKTLDLVLK